MANVIPVMFGTFKETSHCIITGYGRNGNQSRDQVSLLPETEVGWIASFKLLLLLLWWWWLLDGCLVVGHDVCFSSYSRFTLLSLSFPRSPSEELQTETQPAGDVQIIAFIYVGKPTLCLDREDWHCIFSSNGRCMSTVGIQPH